MIRIGGKSLRIYKLQKKEKREKKWRSGGSIYIPEVLTAISIKTASNVCFSLFLFFSSFLLLFFSSSLLLFFSSSFLLFFTSSLLHFFISSLLHFFTSSLLHFFTSLLTRFLVTYHLFNLFIELIVIVINAKICRLNM